MQDTISPRTFCLWIIATVICPIKSSMPRKILAIICSTFQTTQTIFVGIAVTFVDRTFIIGLTASIDAGAARSTGPINIRLTISTGVLIDNKYQFKKGVCRSLYDILALLSDMNALPSQTMS